jgi:allophanate hydrolase subunit 2
MIVIIQPKLVCLLRHFLKESIKKPAVLRVKNVGLQVLIQDEGRKNLAELGVGRAGAMDQKAFRQANLIVGNPKNAAVIEVLNGGAITGFGTDGYCCDRC